MSVQVMSWVLTHSPTAATERLVLLSLANHSDEHGQSWPSVATIAREANVSERATQRALVNLQQMGAVHIVTNGAPDLRQRGDRRTNLYRVLRVRSDAGDTPREERGDAGGSHGVTLVTSRGDAGDTQIIIEPSVNRLGSPSATRAADPLFDSLIAVCELDATKLTKDERGRVNAAVKQLREVEATAADVGERAFRWRRKFPQASITPQSLTKSWTSLAPVGRRTVLLCSLCKQPQGESHTTEACRIGSMALASA